MGDTPYPLPRETRESAILVGDGTAGPYGPSQYRIFDVLDVRVWAKADGEANFADVTDDVTIAKTASQELDTFSVTFPSPVPATTQWYHQAARIAERSVAVTRAQAVRGEFLEKELSKQASVLSELRRDVGRVPAVDPGRTAPRMAVILAGHFYKADENGNLVDAGLALPLPPGGAIGQVLTRAAGPDGSASWTSNVPGGGDMLSSAYNPRDVVGDMYDSAFHTYSQEGVGNPERTVLQVLREGRINVRDLGVKGDGTADDTARLISAFERGGNLYVPAGRYRIASAGADAGGVYATLTGSLDVEHHADAIYVADQLDNDMVRLSVPTDGVGLTDTIAVRWAGGGFDQSAQKNSTEMPNMGDYPPANPGASATCDALSISGWYDDGSPKNGIRRADVTGVEFFAGTHWEIAGGDSAILIGAGIDLTNIERCNFRGQRDLGIYASTYAGLTNGRVNVRDNDFVSCFNGVSFKRSIGGFDASHNSFRNCIHGVQVNYLDGVSLRPRGGTIEENYFYGCGRGARLDYAENVHVLHNLSESLGALDASGDIITIYTDLYGLVLFGGTSCTVRGNRAKGTAAEYLAASKAFRHVGLSSITVSGSPVLSQYNDIIENISDGLYSAGIEEVSKANYNQISRNYNFNPSSGGQSFFQRNGANSLEERLDPANAQRIFMQALLFDDNSGNVMLGRRSQTNTGVYFGTNLVGLKVGGTNRAWATNTSLFATLPTYADDAAAGTGGLTAGGFYKTATGELRIKT